MPEEKPTIPEEEKEAKPEALTSQELMKIIGDWEEKEGLKREGVIDTWFENRLEGLDKFLKGMNWENICNRISEWFRYLYIPAWPEMWKKKQEEAKEELSAFSVGSCRNLFEWGISKITFGMVEDPTDYQRRYEMALVRKETEKLVGEEAEYLVPELERALKAKKLDRAEACVRTLQKHANFNEIMRDPVVGKMVSNKENEMKWNPDACHDWLVKNFGEKRGEYMAVEFARDYERGIDTFDQMKKWDAKQRKFVKRDIKEQFILSAPHTAKQHSEGEWRGKWSETLVDEDYSLPEEHPDRIKPSESILSRLAILTADDIERGLPRSPISLTNKAYAMREKVRQYLIDPETGEPRDPKKYREFIELSKKINKKVYARIVTEDDVRRTMRNIEIWLRCIKARTEKPRVDIREIVEETTVEMERKGAEEIIASMKGKKRKEIIKALKGEGISKVTIDELLPTKGKKKREEEEEVFGGPD